METSAIKVKHPELDARELALEMRTATERTAQAASARSTDSLPAPLSPPPRSDISELALGPAFQPNESDHYHVSSFMHLYDADFVEAVFRAVLKREPDPQGFEFYLNGLRSGTSDRVEVITALLDSEEGKRHQVRVEGLALPRLMRRLSSVPLIGYPIQVGLDLLRLPLIVRRLHHSVAATNQLARARDRQIAEHLKESNRRLSEVATSANEYQHQSRSRADELNTNLNSQAAKIAQLGPQTAALENQQAALANQQSMLEGRLVTMMNASADRAREVAAAIQQVHEAHADLTQYSKTELAGLLTNVQHLRRELSSQRAVLTTLEQASQPAGSRRELSNSTAEASRALDALYLELEDRFRGPREDVRKSQEFYLPLVRSAPGDDLPILDLGSGRGEWLELLRDDGVKAMGVDTNRVMAELCRERGLEVVEQDALTYLQNMPADSLRAVSGFHIIEHLSLEGMMLLLDQIMRCLRPGGFVAFETPNPDNIFVSSNYFYFDPSHRHPLPGKLVELLLEARGFQRIEITPLHPCAEGRFTENDEVTRRLNELFYGPMDYAIVGWKPDR